MPPLRKPLQLRQDERVSPEEYAHSPAPRRNSTPPETYFTPPLLVRYQESITVSYGIADRIRIIVKKLDGDSILTDDRMLVWLAKALGLDHTTSHARDLVRSLLTWAPVQDGFTEFCEFYLAHAQGWKGEKRKPSFREVEIMVKATGSRREALDLLKETPKKTWNVNEHYAYFILETMRKMSQDGSRFRREDVRWFFEIAKKAERLDDTIFMLFHVLLFLHMVERRKIKQNTHWTRRTWWKVRHLPVWQRTVLGVEHRWERTVAGVAQGGHVLKGQLHNPFWKKKDREDPTLRGIFTSASSEHFTALNPSRRPSEQPVTSDYSSRRPDEQHFASPHPSSLPREHVGSPHSARRPSEQHFASRHSSRRASEQQFVTPYSSRRQSDHSGARRGSHAKTCAGSEARGRD